MLHMEAVGPNRLIVTASNSNNNFFGRVEEEGQQYNLLALMFYT